MKTLAEDAGVGWGPRVSGRAGTLNPGLLPLMLLREIRWRQDLGGIVGWGENSLIQAGIATAPTLPGDRDLKKNITVGILF